MRLYLAMLSARKAGTGEVRVTPAMYLAPAIGPAQDRGVAMCLEQFPAAMGWQWHYADVHQVPDDLIVASAQALKARIVASAAADKDEDNESDRERDNRYS